MPFEPLALHFMCGFPVPNIRFHSLCAYHPQLSCFALPLLTCDAHIGLLAQVPSSVASFHIHLLRYVISYSFDLIECFKQRIAIVRVTFEGSRTHHPLSLAVKAIDTLDPNSYEFLALPLAIHATSVACIVYTSSLRVVSSFFW